MSQLDETDRKIIAILRENGREPVKGIATKTGIARSTVRHRLERLETSGIIAGYQAVIQDPSSSKVGAVLLARLHHTPAYDLIEDLSALTEVRRCYSLSGEIDLIIEIEAANAEQLNSVRDRIANHAAVADITTSIILKKNLENGGATG
ncbi:Lrp/AsnC family transcriptional regulator [Aestuariispira insulae]|uniref:AsnC family transcriptional regulator n=1 Tax=Aestuariispira insulae TaxID=1461337 RepID=A0A3D9HY51_9PROT|nr:Lrp/AsnC family transcriptional regulator [Aestuariispira insulae]RED54345.1 AsnC family transcriptional regulator [Aestuariispira insulae]